MQRIAILFIYRERIYWLIHLLYQPNIVKRLNCMYESQLTIYIVYVRTIYSYSTYNFIDFDIEFIFLKCLCVRNFINSYPSHYICELFKNIWLYLNNFHKVFNTACKTGFLYANARFCFH